MPRRFLSVALLVLAGVAVGVCAPVFPPQLPPQAPAAAPPPARPADVSSPQAILAACYDVISGPAGQKRDWSRFLSLFVPGARLIPARAGRGGAPGSVRVLTPGQYVQSGVNLEKNGFFEKSISNTSERYGDIMQIFSTYESRRAASDAKPFARGINSFQLFFDGARWWIVTIYWEAETPATPIPRKYLPR